MSINAQVVAVLIPAYNEEKQIRSVLQEIPWFVDHVVVIDDGSRDSTSAVVRKCAGEDKRIKLIVLTENRGVGGALSIGYAWARDNDVDIAVSLDGDGQMDPDEMLDLITPLLDDQADYAKGNRLTAPEVWRVIPMTRLIGNSILSLLTKVVSGYWTVVDSQSGYSAASRYALKTVPWEMMYPRYGRPNDVLVLANVANCRVVDVPIRPIYGVGERSSMKIAKVTLTIALLLFRRFWWRLFNKYVVRDFHPLVFFYALAAVTGGLSMVLVVRLLWIWPQQGYVPQTTALALAFLVITTLNSSFFAFWMDREANQDLATKLPDPLRHQLSLEKAARRAARSHPAGDTAAAAKSRTHEVQGASEGGHTRPS